MAYVEGSVHEIVYRNDRNGFTVLMLRVGRANETVVGVLPFVQEGESVQVTGEWVDHPDYGRQLKATSCETVMPVSTSSIERFLASGIIKGVGPATARNIVKAFGEATLSVLDLYPERLAEISGIGAARAEIIGQSFQQHRGMQKTMVFLQEHGISPAYAMKIWKTWGDTAETRISQNPYKLCDDVAGIGFKIADKIAMSLGVPQDSPFRVRAGIKHVLEAASMSSGHTYLPYSELMRAAQEMLEVDPHQLSEELEALTIERSVVRKIVKDTDAVYTHQAFSMECEVARRLYELCLSATPDGFPDAEKELSRFETDSGMHLAGQQRQAVLTAVTSGVTVVTGGPGTGKTTIIKAMLYLLAAEGKKTQLCAPTGRAAKRMSEATGVEARTLHRLLEYAGSLSEESVQLSFGRDEETPLEADVVIVDEVSMVDLSLMRALLRALPSSTRLMLVGDADQLPSVGSGNVLKDVLVSGAVPVVRLTEIFRQAASSLIVVNAHRVNRGEIPTYNEKQGDFFFERREAFSSAVDTIIELCQSRLPRFLGIDPMDIQILTPTRKGECGTLSLNVRLQDALNPKETGKPEMKYGDRLFRVGDKVMQIKNNYQAEWVRDEGMIAEFRGSGIYNGDIGFVYGVNASDRTLVVRFDDSRDVTYDTTSLDELETAFAVTVHKSQGSEFECVVIPVMPGPPMLLTRNLLYTAITRAKKLCVLVGREDVVAMMVGNDEVTTRYSALDERLRALNALKES